VLEWMIEFKDILLMYQFEVMNPYNFELWLKQNAYNNMTLNPLVINVARKIYFTTG
jgi:hypothetical protein